MKKYLKIWLRLKEEDLKATFLLLALSFSIGWAISLYLISSQTLFLQKYGASNLPLAFITSGLLSLIVWYTINAIDSRLTLAKQINLKILVVLISIVIITIVERLDIFQHSTFILYAWLRVVLYLTTIVLWGLANNVFNLGAAKRVFPVIAIGEGVAYMLGFFLTSTLLKLISIQDLLYLSATFVLVAVFLTQHIISQYRERIGQFNATQSNELLSSNKKRKGWLQALNTPYLKLLLLLALFPIFSRFFIDFLFLDGVKRLFEDEKSIANFLAVFFGFGSIIEIAFKSSLTSRIYAKYGVLSGILFFPAILIITVGLTFTLNLLTASILLLFSFIALSRLLERSVRASFYEPSFQILYQPIKGSQRFAFQNQIEGIPKAIGTFCAGVLLMFINQLESGTKDTYSNLLFGFLIILIIWFMVTFLLKSQYRAQLKRSISELSTQQDTKTTTDSAKAKKLNVFNFFQGHSNFDVNQKITLDNLRSTLEDYGYANANRIRDYEVIEKALDSQFYELKRLALVLMTKNLYVEAIDALANQLNDPLIYPCIIGALKHFPKTYNDAIVNQISKPGLNLNAYSVFAIHLSRKLEKDQLTEIIINEFNRNSIRREKELVTCLVNYDIDVETSKIKYVLRERVKSNIETTLWLMQTHIDFRIVEQDTEIDEIIENFVEIQLKHILSLCGLMFDQHSVKTVSDIIASGEQNQILLAMEILDTSVDTEMKTLLTPLFSSNLYSDILKNYRTQFSQTKMSLNDRIRVCLNSPIEKIPVCGKLELLNIIKKRNLKLTNTLISLIDFPNHNFQEHVFKVLKESLTEEQLQDVVLRYGSTKNKRSSQRIDNLLEEVVLLVARLNKFSSNKKLGRFEAHLLLEYANFLKVDVEGQIPLTSFYVRKGKVFNELENKYYGEGDVFFTFNVPLNDLDNVQFKVLEDAYLIVIEDHGIFRLFHDQIIVNHNLAGNKV